MERLVNWKSVEEMCRRIYTAIGLPDEDAAIVADNLIQAELSGISSHGITRMDMYVKKLDSGLINKTGEIKILADGPATLLVDGCNCMGMVAAVKAVRLGIAKAREAGATVVGVRNSNHFGTASYYTQMVAGEGMLGISMTNAQAHMAPWGAAQSFLGTNPLSFGLPTAGDPIVLDMATSVVARGKLLIAAEKGESIPLGWALDADGNPTTDPSEAAKGSMLPIAGPKGYGLSMFIDLLSGLITGAGFGDHSLDNGTEYPGAANVGHFFIIIDIARFIPYALYEELVGKYILALKDLPRAEGVPEIYLPGEIEQRKSCENKSGGLMIHEAVLDRIGELCARFGIPCDL